MKNRILICCSLFALVLFSCKKETATGLIGEWEMASVYMQDNAGQFNWTMPGRVRELIDFKQDERFQVFTDMPSGTGTYAYDAQASQLLLNFEADAYGREARSELRKVEKITGSELVVAAYTPSGALLTKTAYSRIR